MQIAICKIRSAEWAKHLQRCLERGYGDRPMMVYYGGTPYTFHPECEVPMCDAAGLVQRRGHIVKILKVKPEEECSQKMNREKSEHYLCSFCDKQYQRMYHRNKHEEKCKGE